MIGLASLNMYKSSYLDYVRSFEQKLVLNNKIILTLTYFSLELKTILKKLNRPLIFCVQRQMRKTDGFYSSLTQFYIPFNRENNYFIIFIFYLRSKQTMRSRHSGKQSRKANASTAQKISSQKVAQTFLKRPKQQKAQTIKASKKKLTKLVSRQILKSFKNSLFNSVDQFPLQKQEHLKIQTQQKIDQKPISSYTNIEETSLSRQIKQKAKQYPHPNGQYFGNKQMVTSSKKSTRGKVSKPQSIGKELSLSLGDKIKQFRTIQSQHQSQSESLKSQISEKEMRRLRKIHSLEKLKLMEEIIGIEQKILQRRYKK